MELIKNIDIEITSKDIEEMSTNDGCRLIDGICHTTDSSYPNYRIQNGITSSNPRIKVSYKEGKGDSGYSELFKGLMVSKAAPAAKIYGSQEHLQQAINVALIRGNIDNKEFTTVLRWLSDSLHSIGAFTYAKGDSTDHMFPDEFLQYMRNRIKAVKELLGPSKDFILYNDDTLLYINDIRIKSRDIERAYWTWFQSDEIQEFFNDNPHVEERAKYMGKLLNRLSAYLWCECRYIAYSKGITQEKVWTSKMNPFPTFD